MASKEITAVGAFTADTEIWHGFVTSADKTGATGRQSCRKIGTRKHCYQNNNNNNPPPPPPTTSGGHAGDLEQAHTALQSHPEYDDWVKAGK